MHWGMNHGAAPWGLNAGQPTIGPVIKAMNENSKIIKIIINNVL
jgi:hypothetical protein